MSHTFEREFGQSTRPDVRKLFNREYALWGEDEAVRVTRQAIEDEELGLGPLAEPIPGSFFKSASHYRRHSIKPKRRPVFY